MRRTTLKFSSKMSPIPNYRPQSKMSNKNVVTDSDKAAVRDICMNEVQKTVQALQERTLKDIQQKISEMTEEVVNSIINKKFVNKVSHLLSDDDINVNSRKDKKKLTEKQFVRRNSLLTDLFEIKHIQSIYHLFLASLIISFMNTCIYDLLENGRLRLGLKYIITGFGKFHIVLVVWTMSFISTIFVYYGFKLWAMVRINIQPSATTKKKAWDNGWLTVFIIYYSMMLYLPSWLQDINFPIVSTIVILCEQARLIMKVHAFVRSNAPNVLNYKPHTEGKENYMPSLSWYIYFSFAPTLVYRDTYPRTEKICWKAVLLYLCEVLGCIFFISFIVEHYLITTFQNFGIHSHSWATLITNVFRSVLPGLMIMLCMFYLVLHAWMNLWAEITQFADRLFYLDWWNATSFGAYYRTWNIVVHDFLYTYIYRDMYEIIFPGVKPVAMCTVFFISAMIHEYIVFFALGFCYPVLFVSFAGIGMSLTFLRVKDTQSLGNIMLWWSLTFGMGIQTSLYSMEFFARINCSQAAHQNAFIDLFIPRSWNCNNL